MIKEQLECLISPPLMFQLELNHLRNTQVTCLAMATGGSDSLPGCPADAFASRVYTPVLWPSYLPGQARGRASALNKAAINNPLPQTGTPAVAQMS